MDIVEPDEAPRRTWIGKAIGVVLALSFMGGAVYAVVKLASGGGTKKPGLQQIALIKQPPPPPPKPPEKQPEPPKVKEEVKIDQPKPEPKPDQPKPADDKPASDKPLGVDSDGAAGSDGFGLAANRGGRDLLTTGSGGGNGRYFTGLLQRNFFESLARNRKAPLGEFSVVVSILLGDDGRVQQVKFVTGSGDPAVDALIESTLTEMPALRELPPATHRKVQLRLNRRA
jgi:hypothetical protein